MADIRTSSDLYNSIVDITKKTGQGIPMFIVDKLNAHEELKELKDADLIQINITRYNYLPDDITITIKKVYNDTNKLHFLRRWLNIDQSNDILFNKMGGDMYNEWVSETEKEYKQWEKENINELNEIHKLTKISQDYIDNLLPNKPHKIIKGDSIFNYLTNCEWYKENHTLKRSIYECELNIENYRKQIDLNEKLSKLYSDPKAGQAHRPKIKECEDDIIKLRSKIKQNKIIQSSIKRSSLSLYVNKIQDLYPM